MDPNAKKTALRSITYGLYVVTSASPSERGAFLCNWLTQCSFTPPLIVMSVENEAQSLKVIRESGRFVVNTLERGQVELASWFGRHSAKVGDKLAKRVLMATPSGQPVLPEALSWFECAFTAQLPAGDHVLIVGEVVDALLIRDGQPMQLSETGYKYSG
ncbi:MAG: flavin reductase [Chloroflexi bacterium]|nr:flavin reductase [Chloroflexota bacterium]